MKTQDTKAVIGWNIFPWISVHDFGSFLTSTYLLMPYFRLTLFPVHRTLQRVSSHEVISSPWPNSYSKNATVIPDRQDPIEAKGNKEEEKGKEKWSIPTPKLASFKSEISPLENCAIISTVSFLEHLFVKNQESLYCLRKRLDPDLKLPMWTRNAYMCSSEK